MTPLAARASTDTRYYSLLSARRRCPRGCRHARERSCSARPRACVGERREGGREGCSGARGARQLAPGLPAGCPSARRVCRARLPAPRWGGGARWSCHPAAFISRKWVFGRSAWMALSAQAGSHVLLVLGQISRSIMLMAVGVSSPRAQHQAVVRRGLELQPGPAGREAALLGSPSQPAPLGQHCARALKFALPGWAG